ncbi:putative Transcription factor domain-containing protein [Seiridium unicorne]|uniref:Transcription factor domain-containing protein n=1 Tax=Seiridium unicorne TaxID=138068 RepID=A0ABR2V6T5_9PEZI
MSSAWRQQPPAVWLSTLPSTIFAKVRLLSFVVLSRSGLLLIFDTDMFDESRVTPVSNGDGATFSAAGITVAAGTLEQFSPLHEPAAPIFESPVLRQQETVEEFSPGMNDATIDAHVAAYFEYFHSSLPILHRASFDVASTPGILVNIVTAIGSLYSGQGASPNYNRPTSVKETHNIWQSGLEEPQRSTSGGWKELRKTWMIQACLLYIVYGVFMRETVEHDKTRSMLRVLVDCVAISNPGTWLVNIVSNGSQHYSTQPHERWQSYVYEESLKLSIYTLELLDHHVLSCCNMRSLLSPIELGWELPLAASLWEAGDAVTWQEKFYEEYGKITIGILESPLRLPRHSSMCSLPLATQSLMPETPNPELIVALSASPMALTCILTNLDALVRDFTRCYYQLPPSPPDPSAFHVLTQSQDRRVITTMRTVSEIIDQKLLETMTEPEQSVWRTCQVLAWSVKLGLCRPHDLLVGGIVESRVFAALLTATHLTIGSYVAFKRMTRALKHPLPGQDCGDDSTIARALRQAISNTREKLEKLSTTGATPKHHMLGSSSLTFNSILETMLQHDYQPDVPVKRARLWTVDPATLTVSLDESEAIFMDLVIRICKDRSVWSIGPSMAAVLAEMITTRAYLQ